MGKLRLGLTLLLSSLFIQLYAQHLAAYTDFQDRFIVFDRGDKEILEYQEVKSFQIGANLVAYVDYADNFKVYHNGKVKTLEIGGVRNYKVTNYLLAYSMTDILKVYDNGKTKTLSNNTTEFVIGDSLIAFYDDYFVSLNAYYNGEIFTQNMRLLGETINKFRAGNNIAAVVTAVDQNFWVFYHGEVHKINDFVQQVNYKVGRDIMGFIDYPTNTFKAFYKGEIYDLEPIKPLSYQMGEELMAYIDQNNNFKVFENGQLATISTYPPDTFLVKDSIIVYRELNNLKAYYKGKIYEIENNFIPTEFMIGGYSLAYLDANQNIKVFQKGESKVVNYGSQFQVNDFDLINNVVIFNVGVNTTLIYYNDQLYE